MFHKSTFVITPDAFQHDADEATGVSGRQARRQQVSKACTWCREYRIRCDPAIPCRNCKIKGRECTPDRGKNQVRTFSAATKEINRLSDRVKELEEQLRTLMPNRAEADNDRAAVHTSQDKTTQQHRRTSIPAHLDPLAELGIHRKYYNWDVITTRKSKPHQQTYGTSSFVYYVNQISLHMERASREHRSNIRSDAIYDSYRLQHNDPTLDSPGNPTVGGCDLSRSAEQTYLADFWNLFHVGALVIDRNRFETYYDKLWLSSRAVRCSSALVDLMLALCIQRRAELGSAERRHASAFDSDGPGIWWHRRGQQLLADDLEEPSITTFQCFLLSVKWLSNAGLHNSAHIAMASGIRIGIILGLHLEPLPNLTSDQGEFRKRLWWTAYALEMRFAMDLGRPIAVNCKQVTCSLPSDTAAVPENEKLALQANVNLTKLILAGRAVYITFYHHCAKELEKTGQNSIYEEGDVLEACATFLASKIAYLDTWAKHVPPAIHLARKAGKPFSVDTLDLDLRSEQPGVAGSPIRHAVLLELHYHAVVMNLLRPFIVFAPRHRTIQVQTQALLCVKHAVATTRILEQTSALPDLSHDIFELVEWQWSAALSLAGFLLAHPTHGFAARVRSAVDTAVAVLNSYRRYSAAETIRGVVASADGAAYVPRPVGDVAPEPVAAQMLEPLESWGLELDPGFDGNDGRGSVDLGAHTDGVVYGTGQSFALQGLEAGDQDIFALLDFEGFGGVED